MLISEARKAAGDPTPIVADDETPAVEDHLAVSVACLSLATKKRCRDQPGFQDLLGATMLQGVFVRHSDLKQYTPSFVRDMQPRVEEYEAFLLHALGVSVDFEDPFDRLEEILCHFRRSDQIPYAFQGHGIHIKSEFNNTNMFMTILNNCEIACKLKGIRGKVSI